MSVATLVPGSHWDSLAPLARELPPGRLVKSDLLVNEFLLAVEGRLSVYWVPFERLNADAQVCIVGLTPGFEQMREAFEAARDALVAEMPTADVLDHIDRAASFAGPMRANLVRMLDDLGVARALALESTDELFGDRDDFVHATSALRYPVFVDGARNYGGSPEIRRTPLLRSFVDSYLGPELEAVPGALIVPLGKAATAAVELLADAGRIERDRCLLGFPHPSGGNGHRVRQFSASRDRLTDEVRTWAARSAGGRC